MGMPRATFHREIDDINNKVIKGTVENLSPLDTGSALLMLKVLL